LEGLFLKKKIGMLHFATLFDKNYLSRGLALLESLEKACSQQFVVYVLALDSAVIAFFQKYDYPQVRTIALEEIEECYPELLEIKDKRSRIEYYFTLSPYLPSYIFQKNQVDRIKVDRITTLDSDLYFFSDPQLIFDAYPDASVLITPHNLSDSISHLVVHGIYNVSFQSFKNNEQGNKCLAQWRKKCHEWCYDQLDLVNNRYADQKYLNTWTDEFSEVKAIQIPGTGLAPWNLDRYTYSVKGKQIYVNDHPLVYFHFHHLRTFNTFFAINAFDVYQVKTRHKAVKIIYQFYLQRLKEISKTLEHTDVMQVRYAVGGNNSLLSKLKNTNGYWFCTSWFIFYLNPRKSILKVKQLIKKNYA
jgi:hypothetical protein